MGYGGNMAFTLEFLFENAMNRPDLYLPLIRDRLISAESRLTDAEEKICFLQQKVYDEKDRFFKLKESAELSITLMTKLIKDNA